MEPTVRSWALRRPVVSLWVPRGLHADPRVGTKGKCDAKVRAKGGARGFPWLLPAARRPAPGDYLVAALSDFAGMDLSVKGGKHVRVHHIKDVQITTGDIVFPLKVGYDLANRAIGEVAAEGVVPLGPVPDRSVVNDHAAEGTAPPGAAPGDGVVDDHADVAGGVGDMASGSEDAPAAESETSEAVASDAGGAPPPPKRGVGRPRTRPVKDPAAPKRGVGRPTACPPDLDPNHWRYLGAADRRRELAAYLTRVGDKAASAEPEVGDYVADRAGAGAGDVSEPDDGGPCPAMPCIREPLPVPVHRDKNPDFLPCYSAAVARPVNKAEVRRTPAAQKALRKEWDRLRKIGCWDESSVREWSDVAAEARRKGTQAHMGRLHALCVEKNSELPADDVRRKFKGRVVFLGNNVKDQNWEAALFQDISSCPATMEAAKAADLYGLIQGHRTDLSDAEQAYTQAKMGGPATWVALPPEEWPAEWEGMTNPVCLMVLSLYGHPDSGGYWERHCEKHLRSVGFMDVPSWRSCFWHPRL